MFTSKQCKKCHITKELICFNKSKENKDGYAGACRDCMCLWRKNNRQKNLSRDQKRSREWYHKNKDRAREININWQKNNPERRKIINRKSVDKNKEKISLQAKIYRDKNRDKIRSVNRVSSKKWRDKNKKRHAEMIKNWREKHKERSNELVKRWARNNPEKIAAFKKNQNAKRRLRKSTGKITHEEWALIKDKANNRCFYCKKKKYLTQDHVIPLSKGGVHCINNVVPACQSCNSKKGNKIITLL